VTGKVIYDAIAEELGGGASLSDLDAEMVETARQYAKRSRRKWPPQPRVTGWQVQVRSWGGAPR
jgi:hypothetical protein